VTNSSTSSSPRKEKRMERTEQVTINNLESSHSENLLDDSKRRLKKAMA